MTAADQLDGDAQPARRWRATLALRIPRNGDGELVTEAATRLEATQGIDSATVETLAGLEPALAATVVRLEVTLTTTCPDEQTARDSLAAVSGLQRVERLETAP